MFPLCPNNPGSVGDVNLMAIQAIREAPMDMRLSLTRQYQTTRTFDPAGKFSFTITYLASMVLHVAKGLAYVLKA